MAKADLVLKDFLDTWDYFCALSDYFYEVGDQLADRDFKPVDIQVRPENLPRFDQLVDFMMLQHRGCSGNAVGGRTYHLVTLTGEGMKVYSRWSNRTGTIQ
ncbi:MAG: hypothetical protein OXF11_14925 [Deltaproteobacteria bacterium]|nr:hypothetical protein [Deltaproteobacteria bacterium]